MEENMEDSLKAIFEGMRKKGIQIHELKYGNQVLKISLEPEAINDDKSLELSEIDQNSSLSQSFSKDSLVRQETSKKISLGGQGEEPDAPNSFMQQLFFDDEELDSPGEMGSPQNSHGDITQHFHMLLNSHPESKLHIEAILQKLEEVETENKERKKKEEELSHILSTSLNTSQNIFDTSSTLLTLEKLSDPLCRLVSSHFKNLHEAEMTPTNEKPGLLFLYSQPLVYEIDGGEVRSMPTLIDYEKEDSNIRNVLNECKIGYVRENASIDKLASWLQSGVELIHFCGHGARGTDENSHSDYLVFENGDGGSYKLSAKELKELLKKMKKSLQFVFVASCHSRQIGEVFLAAGVPHVICVRREERILDEACQEFVKNFYISCLNNKLTICEAFEFAKFQVSLMGFPKGEEHKFIMLKPRAELDDHTCTHLSTTKYGEFKDLTPKPTFSSSIPSRVENFISRPEVMAEVVASLNRNRFITLKGIPGIGKSTLGREIIRYVNFRNKLRDGVIYMQLLGCENIEGFFHGIYGWLVEGQSMKFKGSHGESVRRIVSELKDKHVLIFIDNCDSLLGSNDKNTFKSVIESILRECHSVHFLFTSRNRLGEILNSYELDSCTEKVIVLQKLNAEDSKNLFLRKSPRDIRQDEVEEFLKATRITDLKNHPLFEFMNGHPQAISMSSALLLDRSLKEVYQLLMSQSLADELCGSTEDKKGYNAFRISLEVSWNIIKKREKEAAAMFKVMGMLPSGVDKDTMPKIFGAKWRQCVKVLQKYSLLKESEKLGIGYYSIYPHMLVFAEGLLDHEEKKYYHEKISEELCRRLFERFYKNIGTLSSISQDGIELYYYEENNYKACIYREYAFFGESNKLRSLYSNLLNDDYEESDYDETHSINSSRSSRSKFKMDAFKKGNDDTQSQSSVDEKKPLRHRMLSKSKSPNRDKSSFNKINTSNNFKRKDPPSILRLIIFQATVLFVLKNFSSCEKIINYGRELSEKMKSSLAQANLIRLLACIQLNRRNENKARDLFAKALELFANVGCGLGSASCEAALGYIRHLQQEYAQAKKNLQNALKYYDQIPHIFGKHYLNRWLLNIKTKINRGQNELKSHNEEALKLIKEARTALKGNKIDNFQLKHKAGFFVFRFMFDNLSLFLECAFEIDVKPTKRSTVANKIEPSILKPILPAEVPAKKVLENLQLLPIDEMKEEEKSFIESETKIKVSKFGDKTSKEPKKPEKKMLKSSNILSFSKELSSSKELLLGRQKIESQHTAKWK